MRLMSNTPDIEIDRAHLSKLFGGKNFQGFSCSLNEKIERFTAKATKLLTPQLFYHTVKIDSVGNGVVHLKGDVNFSSKKLSIVMKKCSEAVCFVSTIGIEIENEINRLTEQKKLSDAFILDTLGSLFVEGMANQFKKGMEREYVKEGRPVSLRVSPD